LVCFSEQNKMVCQSGTSSTTTCVYLYMELIAHSFIAQNNSFIKKYLKFLKIYNITVGSAILMGYGV